MREQQLLTGSGTASQPITAESIATTNEQWMLSLLPLAAALGLAPPKKRYKSVDA